MNSLSLIFFFYAFVASILMHLPPSSLFSHMKNTISFEMRIMSVS